MDRSPAVADQFYSADPGQLEAMLAAFPKAEEAAIAVKGAMVPHAGLMYSGAVANQVYTAMAIPKTVVLVGPNHHGYGAPIALSASPRWLSPFGGVPVDEQLTRAIASACKAAKIDESAHRMEHSLEVQLPFLRHYRDDVMIVPIAIGLIRNVGTLEELGQGIAEAIAASGADAAVVASSDMTHYESQDVAKEQDRAAIDRILALDESGLLQTVMDKRISMCGYAPAFVMLVAAKKLGATSARLVAYQTSGDTTGDYASVVGYAGVIVT